MRPMRRNPVPDPAKSGLKIDLGTSSGVEREGGRIQAVSGQNIVSVVPCFI